MDFDRVRLAQQLAEQRLLAAEIVMAHENGYADEDEITQEAYEEAARSLAGPFCGCNTCIIREVLTATWPVLRDHAVDMFLIGLSQPEFRDTLLTSVADHEVVGHE